MAEVTVKQLAETVGRPVDTLLTQMQEAGLAHKSADDAVSDVEKTATACVPEARAWRQRERAEERSPLSARKRRR
jgi:hypothetical protein